MVHPAMKVFRLRWTTIHITLMYDSVNDIRCAHLMEDIHFNLHNESIVRN